MENRLPNRSRPAHGVHGDDLKPIIVFVTVCTKNRSPWLATPDVHALLREVWSRATAWRVGRYVILPDHLHCFVTPGEPELLLDNWVRYWKSQFSKQHKHPGHEWQGGYFDRRLRTGESYDQKWEYVVNNPVRHRLVSRAEDWLFQGVLNDLPWT